MAFPTRLYGKAGWEKITSTTQLGHDLGTLMEMADGRLFRYSQANGAINAGDLVMQDDISNASHDSDLVPAATALGASTVTIASAGAPVTADLFANGWMWVNDEGGDSAGQGMTYRVKSNTAAATTGANFVVTLEEDDPIAEEALTVNSRIGLRKSPYIDVEQWDADDIDGIPLGVAPVNVADNEFFWLQTHGPAAVLYDADDNSTLGRPVIPSVSVDGAVRGYDTSATTTVQINQIVGHAMTVSIDSEANLVFLTIE